MQRYNFHKEITSQQKLTELTKREREVVKLLAWGFTDKEVAVQLGLTFYTARTYHTRIYQKTGARNLADITRFFFEDEQQTSLGSAPSLRRVIAVAICLLLVIYAEIRNTSDFVRAKTARTARVERRVKRKKKKTYQLV